MKEARDEEQTSVGCNSIPRLQFDFADSASFVLTKCGRAKEEKKKTSNEQEASHSKIQKSNNRWFSFIDNTFRTKIQINIGIILIEIEKLNQNSDTSKKDETN